MSRAEFLTYLGWACFGGGAAAIAVYVLHFLGRQGWRRPWNAAGLFFSAVALTQLPLFLQTDATSAFTAKVVCVVCLLIGVGLQVMMTLRTRRRTDDRRAS